MPHTLQSFAARCHDILASENNPHGRARVAALLVEALRNREFVAAQFAGETAERKVIYEDLELGFCILAHEYPGPKDSGPHDHGPSWAIYGQAEGETAMADYQVVEPAASGQAGKVRKTREYKLTPGVVHVYNEGDIHSPSRAGPTRLIRIEGTNLANVERSKFVEVP